MATDGGEPPSPLSSVSRPAEVNALSSYLLRVVPILLAEDDPQKLVNFESILQESEAKLRRFIEDSQEHTLSILRTLPPEGEEEEDVNPEASNFSPLYELLLGVHYKTQRCMGVVFIKRSSIIEVDKSAQSQLRIINISDDSPFETLHAYVQDAVSPLFTSYVQQSRGEER